ncbi:phage tail protein [Metabacillus bambusae]|uniref:Phage tail tape measure protein n=1 Tax=Metabacillus bambusae TaxID=2795218 RepID=A0ABS3NBP5_9BACI|nr:hypothetical protein [Metabacillus bambusae]MBO1515608.1 hypothetical protein [Metabacillus bambusae]
MADGKVVVDSSIDDSGITRGLKKIKDKLEGFNSSLIKTASLGSAIAIAPSLVPALAAATGGALALGASFAAAGIGAGAFGAVAVSALGQVFEASEEVAKLEERIANADSAKERIAAQKELAALYGDMSEAQRGALKELQSFKTFWGDFVKQFETPIFEAFGESLALTKNLFTGLAPTISNVADVVNKLMQEMNNGVIGGGLKDFFGWLESNAAEALYNFAHIAGNTISGVWHLLGAFSPLGAEIEEGLLSLTKRFSEWAASLSASKAFQTFVDYVRENGKTVLSVLGNLVSILLDVGRVLGPVGQKALEVLDILTSFLAGDVTGAIEVFKKAFGEDAYNSVMDFFNSFKEGLDSTGLSLTTIKEFITMFVESSIERFKMVSSFIISAFSIIWTFVQPLVLEMLAFFQEKLQQITQFWKENGEQIMQAVQNAFDFILQVIQFIMPAVMFIIQGVWEGIKDIIDGALNVIMGLIKVFAGLFTGDWSKMWEGVKQLLSGAIQLIWGLIQVGFLGKIFGGIKTFAKKTVDSFMDMVKGAKGKFDDLVSSAKTKFDDIKDKIMTPIRKATDFVKEQIDKIVGFFKNMKISFPKIKLPHFSVSGKFDLMPPGLSMPKVNVDWFKDGGLFPANSPRLIGIGDNKMHKEAALPLSPSVLGMIGSKIAAEMPSGSGESGGLPSLLQLIVDKEVLAEAVYDPVSKKMNQRMPQSRRRV